MAKDGQGSFNELIGPLDAAIANSPAHPVYANTKVDLLSLAYQLTRDPSFAEEIRETIEKIEVYEPYNRQILLAKYRNHKDLEEYKEAMAVLEDGIVKFQWDIKFYEAAVMEYAVNGKNIHAADPDTAQAYWNRGMELYREVLRRMELLENLPEEQLQGRNFAVTPFLRQAVGQIHYARQQYEEAVEILEPLAGSEMDDPYVRTGVRYYLASLHRLGRSDEQLTKRLFEADDKERTELEALLQASS
jgi:tetratricopeptide (TPR) repeat protein